MEQAAQEQLKQEKQFLEVIARVIPAPATRPFQLFGLDVTSLPRPYAQTLADRTFVYALQPSQEQQANLHWASLLNLVCSARTS